MKIIKNKKLIGDISNNRMFSIGTYSALFFVSAVMTVLNIITKKGMLTYCTGVFSVLCIVNVILSVFGDSAASVAKSFFAAEVLLMFTFFLVSGNPDGFSAIWICMLPSIGMMFFNRKRGTLLCAAMLLILVFLLWLPVGKKLLQYDYTSTFKMRFPVLFVAFFLLAFLFETLRLNAYKEMRRIQDYYHDLSIRDPLTKVLNRQGMYSLVENEKQYNSSKSLTVVMLDIDDFKTVNDKYGHDVGDLVLKKFAEIISVNFNALICRWGGEEFVAIFSDGMFDTEAIERTRRQIEREKFDYGDDTFGITTCIGIYCGEEWEENVNIDSFITKADEAMYKAKITGKNKIVFYSAKSENS